MGMMLYPVFDSPTSISSETTGEFLAAVLEELDAAADRLGLVRITEYADNRPIPEDFDGDPADLQEEMGPCDDWFDAAEGKRAVSALADALQANSADFHLDDAREGVEHELRDLAEVLEKAASEGIRFRLELT
jgi:hypothetical protein